MATVLTVLRSGGDFRPEHVHALQRQVKEWAPAGTDFWCLSDAPIIGVNCLPLKYDWPGWWAKMEIFRPDLVGDFLYTDLDNVVVGPLDDILRQNGFILNSGAQGSMWTSLMTVPERERLYIWNEFFDSPQWLRDHCDSRTSPPHGDAAFVMGAMTYIPARWETMLPGQVINISTMATPWGIRKPPGARIILTHRPHRPWTLPLFKRLYEEET